MLVDVPFCCLFIKDAPLILDEDNPDDETVHLTVHLNPNTNQFVRFNFNLRRVLAERSVAERPVTGDIVAFTFLVNFSSFCCCRDTLLVVSTVFTILSGQGEALNIDPASFYVHLYNSLFNIEAVRCVLPLKIIANLDTFIMVPDSGVWLNQDPDSDTCLL
jgi:hypothetical protein